MAKPKLLFVTPSFQSFVTNDIKILQQEYEVIINHYTWQKKSYAPIYWTLQAFAVFFHALRVKIIIVSFGGYWAFWPSVWGKLFGKKVFIILHGTDCAALPEIHYGSLRLPLLKWICGKSYHYANALLPVSESLISTELHFDPAIKHKKQGFLVHYPGLKTPYKTIYNGLDQNFWTFPNPEIKTENQFLAVLSNSQFELKGGDLILEAAKQFPTYNFYLAGCDKSSTTKAIPENVFFLGKLSAEEMKSWYQKTRFYFQLSSFEGFGCALAEAMLCGCIPIGSNVNHIPHIIGKSGFIVNSKKFPWLITQINEAIISEKQELAKQARNHIINNFSLQRRKENLLFFIKNFKD